MLFFVSIMSAIVVICSKRQGVRLIASIAALVAITATMSCIFDSVSEKTELQNVIDIPKNEELQIKKDEDYFSFESASFSAKKVKSNAVAFVFVENTETARVVIENKTLFYAPEVKILIDLGLFTRKEKTEAIYTIYVPKRYITSISPPTRPIEDDEPLSLAHKEDVLTA